MNHYDKYIDTKNMYINIRNLAGGRGSKKTKYNQSLDSQMVPKTAYKSKDFNIKRPNIHNQTFSLSKHHHPDRLKWLINKFFRSDAKQAHQIINQYIRSDEDVYKYLTKLYKKNHSDGSDSEDSNPGIDEQRKGVAKTKLNHIKDFLDDYMRDHPDPISNILEIGCEDCFQIREIGQYLGITNANETPGTYNCLNIENWNDSGYGSKRDSCNLKIYDGENIPYSDDSFDVVIIFQTLHHVEFDIDHYVAMIQRIMRKGGILIIREHNCEDPHFNNLIDIEHGLYGVVRDGNPKYFDKYYGEYRSEKQWDEIIGMNKLYSVRIPTATNSYYAVYKK
jgi:SAM-dependent methyltransferase